MATHCPTYSYAPPSLPLANTYPPSSPPPPTFWAASWHHCGREWLASLSVSQPYCFHCGREWLASLSVSQPYCFHCGRQEQAAIPRRSRTKIATVALTMNPYASNAHAAEQASQLMHQKVVYAMSRLDATKLNPGSKLAPRQFSDSLIELSANRPYFLSPRMGSDQRRLGSDRLQRRGGRRGSRDGLSDQKAWQIDSSIFARRRLEAEGKQYFDTLDIFKRRCQVCRWLSTEQPLAAVWLGPHSRFLLI
jgi:hypothetical protein